MPDDSIQEESQNPETQEQEAQEVPKEPERVFPIDYLDIDTGITNQFFYQIFE